MSTHFNYIVIGAGIVGAATAYKLRQRYPESSIAVIEKEPDAAQHQSSHNSGVIHAGIYYAPGSFKARLCRAGLSATYEFAADNGIATKQTGKLLVATNRAELERMRALSARARDNGVAVADLSEAELGEIEPNISGLGAIKVADTGITDYGAIAKALLARSEATCLFDAEVTAIAESAASITVDTLGESYAAKQLIACAGLQADRLAKLASVPCDVSIVPFRGDFYELQARYQTMFSHLIYPVPDPSLPFLGVHLTHHIDGSVSVGPSAMLALAREQYGKFKFDFEDALDIVSKRGFWRLLARYPRASASELAMVISKRRYAKSARRYCPSIQLEDFTAHRCGIRAQAVTARGELVHDFLFARTDRMMHVLNAPSPAATSALPIAEHLIDSL